MPLETERDDTRPAAHMNAVVTGASGFVGRTLCAALRRAGHHVTAVTRRPAADIDCDRNVVIASIDGRTDWSAALAGADVVFHLAAHVHVLDRREARNLAAFRE